MLEMIAFDADNVVGFRLDGHLSDREFDQVAAAVEEKVARHGRLRIYAEVTSFTGMSPRAFLEDARLGWRNWRRFEKEAIVTDKAWLRKLSEASDRVQPGIDVRAFPTTERLTAREWIQQ